MRNLRIVGFEESKSTSSLPLTACAWDTANDALTCSFGPTSTDSSIELKRSVKNFKGNQGVSQCFKDLTSWDAPSPLPELPFDKVILLHHFSATQTTCLVLAGGDLVLVRENPCLDQERIEIVGSVDVGITAAAWAPDEELLAIVTNSEILILMSRSFEPVTETTFTVDDLQASKHVSIGWGKKETQFQGKRAKALRDPTMPEHVEEGKLSPLEDAKVSVSWRGDGAFLCVNSVLPDLRRVIRVYTREGRLDGVSEPVDGLESALSWKPSGNLIASIKRSAEKLEVVFFERNGLRHGEFDLRISKEDMSTWAGAAKLAWNNDSTVLAVCFKDRTQLWTMGNYHYYLKQEISHPLSNASFPDDGPFIRWNPERPLKFAIYSSDCAQSITLELEVVSGCTVPPQDHGMVAVVDGSKLKLTPFRQAGVPPPMAFCECQLDFPVIDAAISKNGQRIVALTRKGLTLVKWNTAEQNPEGRTAAKPRFLSSLTSTVIGLPPQANNKSYHEYAQVKFITDDVLFLLAPPRHDRSALLLKKNLSQDGSEIDWVVVTCPPDSQNMLTDVNLERLWIQNSANTMAAEAVGSLGTEVRTKSSTRSMVYQLPESESCHIVSVSPTGDLFADDQLLARDCTSFALTDAHIIFTTSQHLLKFCHMRAPRNIQVPPNTPEVDERCRSVERGARIVTVIPSNYAVILQMPRGNLETIYPRLLVLTGVRNHIRKGNYRSAFIACQNHQVDLNILYDYAPEAFLKDTEAFLAQLKKPARIDEFISKLKDVDVTTTLYKDTLLPETRTNGIKHAGPEDKMVKQKVNGICDALLRALSSRSSEFLPNVVTAHVCKRPPDLTAALSLVSKLRQASIEEADLAVSHLCFLTDANRLYDVALSLYDLDLTLLVAQNAQKDPREYMPFLQSLQAQSEFRRKYQIDNYLRNYSKALESLHGAQEHDELELYAVKHSLYPQAMNLYRYDTPRLVRITRLYADHLALQSQHSSSATLYESLLDYSAAYPLYALAHQWRESLTCATLVPLEGDPLRSLAISLATSCADESRDYRAAATIHAEYLQDIPTAAKYLCKGSYFADASRLLSLHKQYNAENQAQIIDSGLSEKISEIIELMADCKSQLAAQIPRIEELRKKKEEDPLAFFGGDPSGLEGADNNIPDNISIAATDASTLGGQSLFTRYGGTQASKFAGTIQSGATRASRMTSKNKKREERKRARGKKGSVYEEEYLFASVSRLIDRVNGTHDEVKRLLAGMLRRGMREQALRVQETMVEIVEKCEEAKGHVWIATDKTGSNAVAVDKVQRNGDIPVRPSGADGVFWDSQIEMEDNFGKREAPEVKVWSSSLSLLI